MSFVEDFLVENGVRVDDETFEVTPQALQTITSHFGLDLPRQGEYVVLTYPQGEIALKAGTLH